VTGALVGIALEQGYIDSLDQPVLDFFPDKEIAYWDDRKLDMTIEDLLTMRTGWDWYEFGIDPNDLEAVLQRFFHSKDWVQFLVDRPQLHQPGTRFEYSTGASHLLAAIIQQATGKTALEYARENLFEPLGITDVDWFEDPQGVNSGGYGLTMRPPDMAKFGYLYLRNGEWSGKQIVPAEWVRASTFEHQHLESYYPSHKTGYGYQWWIFPGFNHYETDSYAAVGYKGQYIFVVPAKDIVVVFSQWEAVYTGQASQRSPDSEIWYLQRFILHASKSDAPLPPNPDGLARLQEGIEAISRPESAGD
jgi:CubicO group peptidase (beta-lactamase class C family)